jgi:translation initiation factor 3 subunit B
VQSIHSVLSRSVCRCRFDSFWDFAWRPRPPSQLPADTEREILKNLKVYAKKYDEQDEQLLAAADTEQMRVRAQKRAEWESFVGGKQAWKQEQHDALVKFLGHEPEEPASQLAEVDVQQIIDVREEPFFS